MRSPQIGAAIGHEVCAIFDNHSSLRMNVNLRQYDLEQMTFLSGTQAWYSLLLPPSFAAGIRRHRIPGVHGHSQLRTDVAYLMVRLANIAPSDVVMDCMSGECTLPIEAIQHMQARRAKPPVSASTDDNDASEATAVPPLSPGIFCVASDQLTKGMDNVFNYVRHGLFATSAADEPTVEGSKNVVEVDSKLIRRGMVAVADDCGTSIVWPRHRRAAERYMDGMSMDVTNMPIRGASVDVMITDPPYGVRHSSRAAVRKLYPKYVPVAIRQGGGCDE